MLPSEISAVTSMTYTDGGAMRVIPGVLTQDEMELLDDSIGLGTDMDFETGGHMEAETETEMQNGAEDGEMAEDSDNDAPAAPAPQVAAAVNLWPPHPHNHHPQGFHGHHFL